MYKWQVHAHSDFSGYAPHIGYVETEVQDTGEAMELAKYYAEQGSFNTRKNEYFSEDVGNVYCLGWVE